VPPGPYEAIASIDLGPGLGRFEHRWSVTIEAPPPGLLEKELRALRSKDPGTRQAAVYELRWYVRDGERVVPVLLGRLSDEDWSVREAALYALRAFPDRVSKHVKVILGILRDEKAPQDPRLSAARLLGETAPPSAEVEAALVALVSSGDEHSREVGRYVLDRYRERHAKR
jgi:HEAT repeat protein